MKNCIIGVTDTTHAAYKTINVDMVNKHNFVCFYFFSRRKKKNVCMHAFAFTVVAGY